MRLEDYEMTLVDGFVVDGQPGFKLQPFDEVFVTKTSGYTEQSSVSVEGEVLSAGFYGLNGDNVRVSDVLKMAGGITPRAATNGAYIMRKMNDAGLIFGASITVTTENLEEVYSEGFIESLRDKGVKAILYIEYVPVTEESIDLAPGDDERAFMQAQMARIRDRYPEIVFIAFPGDEKDSGGCVAAGRGFFHINSHGGAEPCPFSPYSDINVRDTSLKEAIQSRLFKMLRDNGTLLDDHVGGCTLFAKKEEVERYLAQTA